MRRSVVEKASPYLITIYLRKGAQGHNLRAMCTTSLCWEQSSTMRSIFGIQLSDVANTERYKTILAEYKLKLFIMFFIMIR